MSSVLVCEVCGGSIATFEPDDLKLPLMGDMFFPVEAGFPRPFWLDAGWSELICPLCRNRAVGWDLDREDGVRRDRVKTTEGYFIVGYGFVDKRVQFLPDYSALAAEWEAMEQARFGAKGVAEEVAKGEPEVKPKRPYHRKEKKRGR